MKKFLSIFLALTLVLGMSALPVFSSAASGDSDAHQKLLFDLGITDGMTDANDELVTRGQFALEVSRAMGIEKMPAGYKLPYTDVSQSSDYYEGIYNLYAWRVISDAETFRPGDVITSNEALKIAISALGYDFMALAQGGWPAGYAWAASKLGVAAKGMGAQVTKANADEIIFNMLHTKLPTATVSATGETQYSIATGGTLLYQMWGIESVTGSVTDGQYFGTNYDSGVGEGFVAIDGFKLKKGAFDTDSLLGEYVDVYYEKDSLKIRSIYARGDNDSKITTIYTSDDMSYDENNHCYKYRLDDEEEEIEIKGDAVIVYNGKNAIYDESIMVPDYGYVKIIEATGNGSDLVIIKSYEQIVAGTIISNDFLVSDKSKPGVSYKFDDSNIVFTNQDGEIAEFKDISENDVLWICRNEDGEINDVRICSDLVLGELTGTSPGSNKVYLDGRAFEVSADIFSEITEKYTMGSIIRACINFDGDLVYVIAESDVSAYKVGYLMYSALLGSGMNYKISAKILGSDGIVYVYDMADVFVVNGVSYKGESKAIYEKLPKQEGYEKSICTGLVIYNVDKNSKITMLNYSDDVAKTFGGQPQGLYKNAELTDLTDKYVSVKYTNVISNKGYSRIFMNTSTRFYVPMTEYIATADDEDYKVVALSGRMPGELHYGYTLTEGNLASDYVVSKYSMGSGSNEFVDEEGSSYLVKSVSQIIDAEGEQVDKIECLTATGTLKEFYSKELGFFSKYGLKFGDVIMVSADIDGIVSNFHIIHREGAPVLANYTTHTKDNFYGANNFTVEQGVADAKDPNIGLVPGIYPPVDADGKQIAQSFGCVLNNNPGMGTIPNQLVHLGRVYVSQGEFMKVLPYKYDPEIYANGGYDGETVNMYSYSLKGNQVLIVNPKTETVEVGTAFDVKGYTTFGENAHTAVVFGSSVVSMMVLYEYE